MQSNTNYIPFICQIFSVLFMERLVSTVKGKMIPLQVRCGPEGG